MTIVRRFVPLLAMGFLAAVSVRAFAAGGKPATSPSSTVSRTSLFAEASPSSSSTQRRQPWNVFRFLKQSSQFVEILPRPASSSSRKVLKPGSVVWEPATTSASSSNGFAFAPLDDVVMGGASSSAVSSSGKWTGTVTDANNGGFVGIRSTPSFEYDFSQCQGIEVTVRTNAKQKRRYKLGVRDSKEFNGIVWNASFLVNGGGKPATTTKVRIPFDKLTPTLFAGTVPDAQPINKGRVVGIQFVYSKFEYNGKLNDTFQVGDVDLEIVSIKAY
jgi:Complex I intermediate-associated protein 30 (CIA30)